MSLVSIKLLLFRILLSVAHAQEPPPAPVTIPPQTAVQTGDATTVYPHIDGLTDNSVTTTVVDGTPTVLPVWYCGLEATAEACKDCPPTQTDQIDVPQCDDGFNALVLLPALALPGLFLEPPPGLPTLTIDDGTPKTRDPPKPSTTPRVTTTPLPTSTTTEEEMPTGKCRIPQYKVADNAHEKIVGEKPKPSQYDQWKYPPRVPPIEFPVPNNPRASCNSGGGQNGYFNSGFYQSDPTFSRTDGLHAAKQFCDMHRNGSILGPDGMMNNRKVEHIFEGVFDTESSGKITVRAIFDHENRMQRFLGQPDCNERRDAGEIQFLDLSHTAECYRRAAGPVEYCNIEDQLGQQKDSLDTSWKHGGSLFWRCTIFDIFKTPMGEHAGGSPMPAPEIWPDPKKICEGNVESCEPQKWPEGKELWPLEQAGMHPVEDIGT